MYIHRYKKGSTSISVVSKSESYFTSDELSLHSALYADSDDGSYIQIKSELLFVLC